MMSWRFIFSDIKRYLRMFIRCVALGDASSIGMASGIGMRNRVQ
jgi:hypothetical protein